MKTKSLFLILFSISLRVLNAQSVSGFGATTGLGYFSLNQSAFQQLNTRLSDRGFANVPNNYYSWTLDFAHGIYNNFVFNGSLDVFAAKNTAVDSSRSKTTGVAVSLATGYLFHPSDNLFVYPLVGADFGQLTLHSHYLGANKAMDVSASNNYFGLDCSINFDILIGHDSSKRSYDGVTCPYFTLSAGYLYCPTSSYWNNDNFDATNKPNSGVSLPLNVIGLTTASNLSMLYVKLKFGIGYFTRN